MEKKDKEIVLLDKNNIKYIIKDHYCIYLTTLAHEVGDHTMESGALEVERLARPADTLLTGAESTEVLSGLRNHISTEL